MEKWTRVRINSKSTETSRGVVHDIKSHKKKVPTVDWAQYGFCCLCYFTAI